MRNPARLKGIEIVWPACCDVAEGTSACANVAHDHHSCVALAPTFASVWTSSFFADCYKIVFTHDVACFLVTSRRGRLYPNPCRFFRLRIVRLMSFLRVPLVRDRNIAHCCSFCLLVVLPYCVLNICKRHCRAFLYCMRGIPSVCTLESFYFVAIIWAPIQN